MKTHLVTNEHIYVFWAEQPTELTTIAEVDNDVIHLHQNEDWISITPEVIFELNKILKNNK